MEEVQPTDPTVDQPPSVDPSVVARLTRRLERERAARREAEAIAERGLLDLYQRQQEARLLESVAVAANAADTLVSAAARTLPEICDYMGWELGHVLELSGDGDDAAMVSVGAFHTSGDLDLEDFMQVTHATRFSRGCGLPGRVWETSAPVWVTTLADAVGFPRLAAAAAAGLQGAAAFPIQVADETVGVIEFLSRNQQPEDSAVTRVMRQIGGQLGRVAERERVRSQLLHGSLHDPLTNLGNRASVMERLEHLHRRRDLDPDTGFALMLLDLDRFKAVNDSLGHHAGDDLILAVAARLRASLRSTDDVAAAPGSVLARLGGDEFIVVLDGIREVSQAVRVASRLQSLMAEAFTVSGRQIHISASIGIALSVNGYDRVTDMLSDADIAMYRAKGKGGARHQVFDAAMRENVVNRLQDEEDLRYALNAETFTLAYQPIVTPDGAITAFEALLRWHHPVRGWVSPADVVELAEEIGLIGALGQWVLREACTQVAQWQRDFNPSLAVSVNLSPRQLDDPDLAELLLHTIRDSGISPGTVKLELTEGALMNDPRQAVELFSQLKGHGVEFSLDDFGTGYSSLSQLAQLPLDNLKLDRAFVTDIDVNADRYAIARLIVSLARTLGMKVVAEGAETAGEVEELRSLGIDLIQGYYFHRPLTPAAVHDLFQLRTQAGVLA